MRRRGGRGAKKLPKSPLFPPILVKRADHLERNGQGGHTF